MMLAMPAHARLAPPHSHATKRSRLLRRVERRGFFAPGHGDLQIKLERYSLCSGGARGDGGSVLALSRGWGLCVAPSGGMESVQEQAGSSRDLDQACLGNTSQLTLVPC